MGDYIIPKGLYVSSDLRPIIFDSGCSIIVTPYIQDFVGELQPVNKSMSGFNGTAEVEREAMVEWVFRDDYGISQTIQTKSFFVPSSKVILFSPQCYFIQ